MFVWLRTVLRRWLFRFLQRVAATEDVKAMATQTLRGLLDWRPYYRSFSQWHYVPMEYLPSH
jgi:hypothetical protein